jgi:antitoxin (DNA-binding transcriptional repressor) of toxin-antitoxin stability system
MINADASEVASNLEGYLRKAQSGEIVIISIRNQPIAELRPIEVPTLTPRPFGLCAGEFIVPDDFDAPLPDDVFGPG